MIKRTIPSLLLATLLATSARAETRSGDASSPTLQPDSIRTTIYFRLASSRLEFPYMNNAAHMESLASSLRSMGPTPASVIKHVRIISSTSPEGNTKFNKDLCDARGKELHGYLKSTFSLPDSVFSLTSIGENWQGLYRLISQANVSWRDRALHIIRNTPIWVVRNGQVVDGRKRQLMNLEGGRAWQYMKENIFPELRVGVQVVFVMEENKQNNTTQPTQPTTLTTQPPQPTPPTPPTPPTEPTPEPIPDPTPTSSFSLALKTNLLYDVLLVPNIGIELPIGNGWSIGANGVFAWWSNDSKHRYWRIYGGELGIRKYFGSMSKANPLQGHHLGVYTQQLSYDLETGGKGYLSDYTYSVGLDYGYSLPVARRLNLDFSLGVGYNGGKYKVYEPEDNCYVYQETKRRHWLGPTRAEVSLVWLIGHDNMNKKKGGKK